MQSMHNKLHFKPPIREKQKYNTNIGYAIQYPSMFLIFHFQKIMSS